jgi:hypothetical protein
MSAQGRLAAAELAVAALDPDAKVIIREAISRAEDGGHLLSLPRLRELARLYNCSLYERRDRSCLRFDFTWRG